MKKITSILKRALRKSANNLIKEDDSSAHSGAIGMHNNCTTPTRAANTFPGSTPGGEQCAGRISAIKCSALPSGWDVVTMGDPCNQPGVNASIDCYSDSNNIKIFPPQSSPGTPPLSPQNDDGCHGGYTPVVGDYILSGDGSGIPGSKTGWVIYSVGALQTECDGPRRNYPTCATTINTGCTDPTANNYNSFAFVDCNGDAPGTNNPGWNSCCTYPTNIPGCTDPTALNYNPNATTNNGSCIYPSFDCISGLCEENIQGTGIHATLNDCLISEECDRYECLTTQDPGAMEEQIAPQPTISNCVKCDTDRYDVVNEMWDPLCQYFDKQECDTECTPVETPVDPCEDFQLGIFQGTNPCCELCGPDPSTNNTMWNTSTYVGPGTHPNLPQCWYTCQCCTMPVTGVTPVNTDIECQQCDGGAPIAGMFPGPLCPAGWTPASQFNPKSCDKKPSLDPLEMEPKMIEPTKDVRDMEVPLNEGLQLKGELLNKPRMTELANIKKK